MKQTKKYFIGQSIQNVFLNFYLKNNGVTWYSQLKNFFYFQLKTKIQNFSISWSHLTQSIYMYIYIYYIHLYRDLFVKYKNSKNLFI